MKIKYFAILIVCLVTTSVFAQTNLNNYKYVIVPDKFDFLNEKDQFSLNSLTEFLFEKYGFEAYIEGEKFPDDLVKNRCLALKSNLLKDSGVFKTKLTVELKNCDNQVIFTSQIGESREKQYDKAYNEATRNAFKSFAVLNYKYVPSPTSNTPQEVVANDNQVAKEIQQLKEEIETLKKEKEEVVENIETPVPMIEKAEKKQAPEAKTSNNAVSVKEIKTVTAIQKAEVSGILYAQAIENGFQLVDSTPKVLYKFRKSGIVDVFLVENNSAIIYKKGDSWILEYYENNVLKQDVLNIKF